MTPDTAPPTRWTAAPGVLIRDERSMIPPVGHPRRARFEQCVREAGKVLADAFDTGRVQIEESTDQLAA